MLGRPFLRVFRGPSGPFRVILPAGVQGQCAARELTAGMRELAEAKAEHAELADAVWHLDAHLDDAKAYAAWLSGKTRMTYRLLSEAEREYVTRAGTKTAFWWGSSITPKQANYDGSVGPYKGGGSKGEYRERTVPVDSFEPNPWGFYNVHGNVWEWTDDCWNDSNAGNPGDGRARTTGTCTYAGGPRWFLI